MSSAPVDPMNHDRDPEAPGARATRAHRRRLPLVVAAALAAVAALALLLTSFLRHDPAEQSSATTPPWGGGYLTGLASGPLGVIARTDVGGAYRFDAGASRWSQLLTPSALQARPGASSVLAITTSPTRPDALVAAVGLGDKGGLIASDDRGATWHAVGPAMYVNGNEADRIGGSRLAHVGIGDTEYVYGSQRNGAWRVTSSGDVTPLTLPGVPAKADVGAVAARSGALWVGVTGVGVFHSTDAKTFTKVLGTKAKERVQKLVATDSGTYVALGDDGTRRLQLIPSAATGAAATARPLAGGWTSAEAFDASPDGRRLIVIDAGTKARTVFTSADAGATWRRAQAQSTGLEGSWAQILTHDEWLSVGDVQWDPQNPDRAMLAEGSGAFEIRDATSDHPTYHWASTGIQELVANDLAVTSAGTLMAAWDRPVFLDKGTGDPAQVLTTRFNSAWSVATAPNDPNVVAAVVDDRRDCCTQDGLAQQSSLSTDGGVTWTRFGSLESGSHPAELRFGTLVVGHAPNPTLLWEATDNAGIWRSEDQGRTWTRTTTAPTGHKAFWLRRHTLVADPHTRGTYWSFQADGLKKSTDDGKHWQPVPGSSAIPAQFMPWNGRLIALPAVQNGLIFSSGPIDGSPSTHWLATDGGATWKHLSGADDTSYITARTDGDRTTLYAVKADQQHLVSSTDLGQTWTDVPDVTLDFQPSDISALVVRPGTGGAPDVLTVAYAGNTTTTTALPRTGR